MQIIDAHCHIYPSAIAERAVRAVDGFYGGLPDERLDGTAATLLRTGAAAGIGRFVVHSVATKPRQVPDINRFIAESVAASGGRFTGLGTLHPDSDDLRRDLRGLTALGLHGVKLHPDIQRFPVDGPAAMRIFGLLEEEGLPVLVHTGDRRWDFSNPRRVARVLRTFPGLRFAGAHFGGWSVWDEAARELPGYPNITVDCSSTAYALPPEKLRELIEIWTPARVMFGTDYPFWPQGRELEVLRGLGLPEDDLDRILWRNAADFYGIAP